ncbi:uncharacterized protein LY89DRAFT_717783 [Mollisia scopiformis]|uniref:Type 1 phosphatases regulator n=1 Tax=Mollisia scopiformis TaxID=149040 RepID=A0A194XEK0_MOLSC|nr:uncharacterized protein LY89DRAFT_717783 [Mollisia scopiformis]KUJ18182.1 hypothetical protein LY89DRAFT_717783 [Mollisia scopiformis]
MAAASAPGPASGQTQTQVPAPQGQTQTQTQQAVLHLRGATRQSEEVQGGETRRRIQWAEDVVDNEGMGKKKSKVCCIYHAPKGIDESSDESSSDSSGSDSDSGDDGAARPARKSGCGHGHDHGKGKGKSRARSPNAYEKMPKPKGGAPKG